MHFLVLDTRGIICISTDTQAVTEVSANEALMLPEVIDNINTLGNKNRTDRNPLTAHPSVGRWRGWGRGD